MQLSKAQNTSNIIHQDHVHTHTHKLTCTPNTIKFDSHYIQVRSKQMQFCIYQTY